MNLSLPFLVVTSNMILVVPKGFEVFHADCAIKWSFICVIPHMHFQIPSLTEAFIASFYLTMKPPSDLQVLLLIMYFCSVTS